MREDEEDEGCRCLLLHFPAGDEGATGYNGVFLARVPPLKLLLPLVCVSSLRVAAQLPSTPCWDGWSDRGMAGCRNLTVPDGLVGCSRRARWGPHSSVFTHSTAVPRVALARDRPFSQPWLCLPVLSRSNISSPTSARPKRYFCYKPLQNKWAVAGKGDKPKGCGTRDGWDAASPQQGHSNRDLPKPTRALRAVLLHGHPPSSPSPARAGPDSAPDVE